MVGESKDVRKVEEREELQTGGVMQVCEGGQIRGVEEPFSHSPNCSPGTGRCDHRGGGAVCGPLQEPQNPPQEVLPHLPR